MNSSASKGLRRLTGETHPLSLYPQVVYGHCAAVHWLHNQVNTCIPPRVSHGSVFLELPVGTAPDAKRGYVLAARPRHRTSSRIALVTIAKISSEISGILCAVTR